MATLSQIYEWFMTGKKPTQAQFWASWGSFWNKEETIPQSAISNLTTVLNAKMENDQFNAHKVAGDAHTDLFLGKEDISQKGVAGGYVPLNEFSKIAYQFLSIVNNLTTGGTTSLLSAEQGVVLQTQIDGINLLLTSNDVNLDTVQEIVDAIKTVETSLSSILVNNLTSGGTTKALTAEMGKTLKGLIYNRVNFLVFSCQISQSNSGHPEVLILQNNLAINITFIRESVGIYKGIFSIQPLSTSIVPFAALGSVSEYNFGSDDITLNGSPSVHASYFDDGFRDGIKVVSLLNGQYSDSILNKAYLEIKFY